MLLKIIIHIIIIFLLMVKATDPAIFHAPYHDEKIFKNDLTILQKNLMRNPDDMSLIKKYIMLAFTLEKFQEVEKWAPVYLNDNMDKKIAEIYILSLENLNRHEKAIAVLGKMLRTYRLSGNEKTLLSYKLELLRNQIKTGPSPQINQNTFLNETIIISYIPRDNLVLAYDQLKNINLLYKVTNKTLKPYEKKPEYLKDIDMDSINYISQSANGREILLSLETKKNESEIFYRNYIPAAKIWTPPLKISDINIGTYNSYAAFTRDGKKIIFSSNADSANGMEFFISMKTGIGSWGAPVKLKGINTPLDEASIYLHPDGETIFFSSNGRPGKGGFDIFSGKLSDTGDTVSTIENVHNLNTFRNEAFPLIVTADSETGFFNYKKADISKLYIIREYNPRPKPVSFFDCYVYDRDSGTPVKNSIIQIVKVSEKSVKGSIIKNEMCHDDGFCGMSLLRNTGYVFTINAGGYQPLSEIIPMGPDRDLYTNTFYLTRSATRKITQDAGTKEERKILFFKLSLQNCPPSAGNRINREIQNGLNTVFKNDHIIPDEVLSKSLKESGIKNCNDRECYEKTAQKLGANISIYGSIRREEKKLFIPLGDKGEKQYILKLHKINYYTIKILVFQTDDGTISPFEVNVEEKDIRRGIKTLTEKIRISAK